MPVHREQFYLFDISFHLAPYFGISEVQMCQKAKTVWNEEPNRENLLRIRQNHVT